MTHNETNAQLEQWFQLYHIPLHNYIRSKIGSNYEQREDIEQEVFIRAQRSLKVSKDRIEYPRRWLEKIAEHVCQNHLDKVKQERDKRLYPSPSNDEEENTPFDTIEDDDISTQPEHQVEEEEWKALLKRELATLPPNERKAIYLRFIKELPIKQIALLTGRSQSTVHNDIRQGLKALRLKLVDLHIHI